MKKIIVIILLFCILTVGGLWKYERSTFDNLPTFYNNKQSEMRYTVKKSGRFVESFNDKKQAVEEAEKLSRSIVIDSKTNEWIYSELSPFLIITDTAIHDFDEFESALRYAKRNDHEKIYFKNDKHIIWQNKLSVKEIKLNVSLIMQLPELPRGCEVTSLAMLLQYNNQKVNKLTLAKEIKKDTTSYKKDKNGRIYYGNPYNGFVGNMYDYSQNGYGVYHGPIAALAQTYFPNQVIDLTGCSFEDLLYFVGNKNPVWIVTNATYNMLPEEKFEIWHTPTGIVKVTKKQHSVVITGYDAKNIYINDPLYSHKNRKLERNSFIKAWEQMGNQAVVIIP